MSKPNPEPSTAERADDWGSRRHVRTLFLSPEDHWGSALILAYLSIVGGLLRFGAAGFILGPGSAG